jgi:hypothetical protein
MTRIWFLYPPKQHGGMVQAWVAKKLLTACLLLTLMSVNFFEKLLWGLVTSTIFVRCQRLIARKLAVLFCFNHNVRLFYAACCFDDVSRGSVSCLLNASFVKRFHNATTRFFTPKLMTMASSGAIRGEYSPDGGVQWHLG